MYSLVGNQNLSNKSKNLYFKVLGLNPYVFPSKCLSVLSIKKLHKCQIFQAIKKGYMKQLKC